MDSTQRWRIRVTGVVQGVGYRPFVYTLAQRLGVAGWVLNDTHGVLVEAQARPEVLARFTAALRDEAPLLARVTGVEARPCPVDGTGTGFAIRHSEKGGRPDTIVPADSHVCADCLRETFDPTDRRYRYPFTNCTHCGPRYSLIRALPYDREQTTMAAFTMCPRCQHEYEDPLDRRYHAQPNACPECGPRLFVAYPPGETGYDAPLTTGGVSSSTVDRPLSTDGAAASEAALAAATAALRDGRIVAVKSVGGFHLAVNARDGEAVARLRKRKRRDAKPFALMVADLATAATLVEYSPAEAELLQAPARPIVLLRKRAGALPEQVAPRNPSLGIMLASAPLHHLLLAQPGLDVLVMTSGNVSGHPIAFRNEDALAQLFEVADLILYHDRDIEIRVDDSVVRLSSHPDLTEPVVTFLRRSRGYAPYPLELPHPLEPIVAYGAELKTTVALTSGSRVYVSQHIGDLKNQETFESHQRTVRHLIDLHDLRPGYVACDLHPEFRATRYALAEYGDAVIRVQHHHAHMAACMAENGLTGPTLGVVFDGAGFGEDGTIWGGEFLLGDYAHVTRVAHLRRLALIGGDKAVHEPIRTAYALALDAFGDAAVHAFPVLATLDEQRRTVFAAMAERGVNAPPTSSMGRLFDAVAALVGVCPYAEYEAHGPIELEGLLGRDLALADPYPFGAGPTGGLTIIDPRPMVRALAADVAAGMDVAVLSRRFHSGVVDLVLRRCQEIQAATGVSQVVVSGGVFSNEFVLVNCLVELRRLGFDAYGHRLVPPGDGGVSLGQVAVAHARITAARAQPTTMD
jgi:hydrogenase maturation protein HypF